MGAKAAVCEAALAYFGEYEPMERFLVLSDEAGLVSHVAFGPREVRAGEATIPVLGVGWVATRPDRRRRGLARLLVSEAHAWGRSAGLDWAVLFTGVPDVYRTSSRVEEGRELGYESDGGFVVPGAMVALIGWRPAPPWPIWPQGSKSPVGPPW